MLPCKPLVCFFSFSQEKPVLAYLCTPTDAHVCTVSSKQAAADQLRSSVLEFVSAIWNLGITVAIRGLMTYMFINHGLLTGMMLQVVFVFLECRWLYIMSYISNICTVYSDTKPGWYTRYSLRVAVKLWELSRSIYIYNLFIFYFWNKGNWFWTLNLQYWTSV